MKFDDLYKELTSEAKWAKDVKIEPGKMHKLLGIPADERIIDHYTSGEKLAKDLVKALDGDQKKAAGMLAFAANVDKKNNVLDAALKALKKIESSIEVKPKYDDGM